VSGNSLQAQLKAKPEELYMNQTERTQHTRGPWRINERDESSWRIFGPDRGEGLWADEIAEVSYTGGNAEANARLIASAHR
jgi:hypothetical protein